MSEINYIEIHDAEASFDGDSLEIRLFYPKDPKSIKNRLPANPSYGVSVFKNLILSGSANIANEKYPIHPAGGRIINCFK